MIALVYGYVAVPALVFACLFYFIAAYLSGCAVLDDLWTFKTMSAVTCVQV